MDLTHEKMVFFHTENFTFHVAAKNSGDLPNKVSWYESYAATPSLSGARPSKRRSRPPKDDGTPSSAMHGSTLMPSPSVIFCTWLPRSDEWVAVELWQYLLPP